jgi:hypothetical protein
MRHSELLSRRALPRTRRVDNACSYSQGYRADVLGNLAKHSRKELTMKIIGRFSTLTKGSKGVIPQETAGQPFTQF